MVKSLLLSIFQDMPYNFLLLRGPTPNQAKDPNAEVILNGIGFTYILRAKDINSIVQGCLM